MLALAHMSATEVRIIANRKDPARYGSILVLATVSGDSETFDKKKAVFHLCKVVSLCFADCNPTFHHHFICVRY